MSQLARLVIAVMLALAVPVQAIGAVTAGICMALGHHDDGDHGQTHHSHADEHEGATHEHASGEGHASSHCPPCASCCAAAAISSFAAFFSPEPPIASAIPRSTASFAGIQPDLPDRPPLAL